MRKFLIGFGITAALLLGLTVAALIVIRCGPTAAVPTQDPIARLNAEHANLESNAADLYATAFQSLRGELKGEWTNRDQWRFGDPVPEDVADWVAKNADAIEATTRAARMSNCWFPLKRDAAGGSFALDDMDGMRALAKLCYARARVAAAEHDLQAFAESVETIDHIGRHAFQPPLLITHLVGLACLSLSQDAVLAPYAWPAVSPENRAAYAQRIAVCFDPPPSLAEAFTFDQESCVWMVVQEQKRNPGFSIVAPAARVAGELEQRFAPLHAIAAQPPTQQADPDNPLRRDIEEAAGTGASWLNPPRMFADLLAPSLLRTIDLHTRVIITQRAGGTVVELFSIRDRTGKFPDSLDAIAGVFKIDPYTGQPFIYRLTNDGFTLYSVGVDRDDDGGTHHSRFGEQRATTQPAGPPDGDYVFWPIQ